MLVFNFQNTEPNTSTEAETMLPARKKDWTENLEEIMARDVDDNRKNMIFLHRNDGGFRTLYTNEEMRRLNGRSFESRLFITSQNW
jgi:hypothetical protein